MRSRLHFLKQQLGHFLKYCDAQVLTSFEDITPNIIREFLLRHEETGHNPGGLHAAFRVLHTFLLWYECEAEPDGWTNPIHKVKAPKLAVQSLIPVEVEDFSTLVKTCNQDKFLDYRDEALMIFLLDTWAAREVLNIDIQDVDLVSGATLIERGKGAKPHTVFLRKASLKSMRAYLNHCVDNHPALWVAGDGERLVYGGLCAILTRRVKLAGVKAPSLHSFRRAFAINLLRAGVDVFRLIKLIWHADRQELRCYLAQTTDDIAQADRMGSSVDNNKL